jgi:FlaA1/EpsC-like NDP-sugar epimerase
LIPNKDIKIKYTGPRPGEKLSEELWNNQENPIQTSHPKIYKTSNYESYKQFNLDEFHDLINMGINHGDKGEIRSVLKKLVFTYKDNGQNNKSSLINTANFQKLNKPT